MYYRNQIGRKLSQIFPSRTVRSEPIRRAPQTSKSNFPIPRCSHGLPKTMPPFIMTQRHTAVKTQADFVEFGVHKTVNNVFCFSVLFCDIFGSPAGPQFLVPLKQKPWLRHCSDPSCGCCSSHFAVNTHKYEAWWCKRGKISS